MCGPIGRQLLRALFAFRKSSEVRLGFLLVSKDYVTVGRTRRSAADANLIGPCSGKADSMSGPKSIARKMQNEQSDSFFKLASRLWTTFSVFSVAA